MSDKKQKKTSIFICTLLCGASKGFMEALNTFIKHFEATQSLKIKISVNFYFNTTFWNAQNEKG